MAKDAEKRRKEEERMAAAARARQADKDASKREHKAAEEARKLAEARELAAAAKRELQLARGGSGDLRRSSLDKPARGPKPGPTRGTDPSWDARDAFAPPPRSATISLSDLFGEVEAATVPAGRRPQVVWQDEQRLTAEKETLGLYLTGHPLDRLRSELGQVVDSTLDQLQAGAPRSLAGLELASGSAPRSRRPP